MTDKKKTNQDENNELTEEQRIKLYKLGDYVSNKHVEELGDKATIVDEGTWYDWENEKEGTSGSKPTIGVQFPGIPKVFEYRIPASTLGNMEKKLGPAHKRKEWLGASVQFVPKDDGFNWTDCIVTATPEENSTDMTEESGKEDEDEK